MKDICPSRDDAQPHIVENGRCVLCLAPVCPRCHGAGYIAWTAANSAAFTPVTCPACGGKK
jgi:hypothetical protein